jgi:hypothetical protein
MTDDPRDAEFILYDRDAHGTPFAVEVVDADAWRNEFLSPPEPGRADVRVVRLARPGPGAAPADLPRWLAVEETDTMGVAEAAADYGTGARGLTGALATGRALWPWSPSYRESGASADEFMVAGAAAARHPQQGPAAADQAAEIVVEFASGRPPPLGDLATLRAEALERSLAVHFGDGDGLAFDVLLARIEDDGAADIAGLLRFVRDAVVSPGDPPGDDLRDLSLDRDVTLERASPWLYFEGGFELAVAAARAWRDRYTRGYERYYYACLAEAVDVRRRVDAASAAARALERLNGVTALGLPLGEAAISRLAALPEAPDGEAPRTAGIVLGERPAVLAREAHGTIAEVQQALDVQRGRLAARVAALALERASVPALDRLLQAITASGLDPIERMLDAAAVEHIERLLTADAPSPLEQLARLYPTVTAETLDEAAAGARELLTAAIEAAPTGQVILRADRV